MKLSVSVENASRRNACQTPYLGLKVAALLLSACAGSPESSEPMTQPNSSTETDSEPFRGRVFAHSPTMLLSVDPSTLEMTEVGEFHQGALGEAITDIAINRDGKMLAVGFKHVFKINTSTGRATELAPLGQAFNALTFLPSNVNRETLIGIGNAGTVWSIDPDTGALAQIGNYGLKSSGDIVGIQNLGVFATAVSTDSETDVLVQVDPETGIATTVGDTGYDKIWGLGFWGDRLYGFTNNKEFLLIDPRTAETKLVSTGEIQWYGAGVTTEPDIVLE